MKSRFLKVVSAFVLSTFLITSVDPVAYANTPEAPVSPFKTLEIPAEFGQVTDAVISNPAAPAFIHIQSAHGNFSAEKNIEKLLEYIEKKSSVRLMFLEGAASKLQPELFRIFPKAPDFNRKVTDKLMQEGYLTGPESFLINSGNGTQTLDHKSGSMDRDKWNGFGVENLEAYKKDRETFISVVKSEKSAEKYSRELRVAVDQRFASKLNKNLQTFVRQEEAFDSRTLSFESWLKALGESSRKHLHVDLSDAFYQDQYPFLIRYYRLQAIGSKIDREKARQEAQGFLKEIEKRKIAHEIIFNFQAILDMSETDLLKAAGRTSEGYSTLRHAFDSAFEKLPKDFSMKAWPDWTLYAQYIILMQEMEGKGLHEETARLQDRLLQVLAKTPEEKEYLVASRQLYLLKRLFSLELTRGEYEELEAYGKTGKAEGVLSTANNKTETRGAGHRIPFAIQNSAVQKLYDSAMSFYSTAVVREQYMFSNALQRLGEQKENRAVIVTGGFHAEGLKQLAVSSGCSYLQITPRIMEVTKRDREVYLKAMLGSPEFQTGTREPESSQIQVLLGIVGRLERVAVMGMDMAKRWWGGAGRTISMEIPSGPDRPTLVGAFAQSIFASASPAVGSARFEARDPLDTADQVGRIDRRLGVLRADQAALKPVLSGNAEESQRAQVRWGTFETSIQLLTAQKREFMEPSHRFEVRRPIDVEMSQEVPLFEDVTVKVVRVSPVAASDHNPQYGLQVKPSKARWTLRTEEGSIEIGPDARSKSVEEFRRNGETFELIKDDEPATSKLVVTFTVLKPSKSFRFSLSRSETRTAWTRAGAPALLSLAGELLEAGVSMQNAVQFAANAYLVQPESVRIVMESIFRSANFDSTSRISVPNLLRAFRLLPQAVPAVVTIGQSSSKGIYLGSVAYEKDRLYVFSHQGELKIPTAQLAQRINRSSWMPQDVRIKWTGNGSMKVLNTRSQLVLEVPYHDDEGSLASLKNAINITAASSVRSELRSGTTGKLSTDVARGTIEVALEKAALYLDTQPGSAYNRIKTALDEFFMGDLREGNAAHALIELVFAMNQLEWNVEHKHQSFSELQGEAWGNLSDLKNQLMELLKKDPKQLAVLQQDLKAWKTSGKYYRLSDERVREELQKVYLDILAQQWDERAVANPGSPNGWELPKEKFGAGKKVCVVGGLGFIGSNTAWMLKQLGYDVTIYDNRTTGHIDALPQGVKFEEGDISDSENLARVLREQKIDTVVHFAADIQVAESVANPSKYYEDNVRNTGILLEAMRIAGVKNIIFSSSAAVYGDPETTPINEDARKLQTSPYGRTKWLMEKMIQEYVKKHGFNAVALRYFNAAGAFVSLNASRQADFIEKFGEERGYDRLSASHIIPIFVNLILQGKNITIFGKDYPTADGTNDRDYVATADLAVVHALAVKKVGGMGTEQGHYLATNVGTGVRVSNLQIAQMIIREIERQKPGWTYKGQILFGGRRPGDPAVLEASTSLAKQELGFEAKIGIEEIIAADVRWRIDHPQGYQDELKPTKPEPGVLNRLETVVSWAKGSELSQAYQLELLRTMLSDEINKYREAPHAVLPAKYGYLGKPENVERFNAFKVDMKNKDDAAMRPWIASEDPAQIAVLDYLEQQIASYQRSELRTEQTESADEQALIRQMIDQGIRIITPYGAPASGKGTLVEWLLAALNQELEQRRETKRYEVLVMSDRLKPILEAQYPEEFLKMKRGVLVDNNVIIKIVDQILAEPQYQNAYGIIFDGFPRTAEQLDILPQIQWQGRTIEPDLNILFNVPDEVLLGRTIKRINDEWNAMQEKDVKKMRPDAQKVITASPDGQSITIDEAKLREVYDKRMAEFYQFTQPVMDRVRILQKGLNIEVKGYVDGSAPGNSEILTVRQGFVTGLNQKLNVRAENRGKELSLDRIASLEAVKLVSSGDPIVAQALQAGTLGQLLDKLVWQLGSESLAIRTVSFMGQEHPYYKSEEWQNLPVHRGETFMFIRDHRTSPPSSWQFRYEARNPVEESERPVFRSLDDSVGTYLHQHVLDMIARNRLQQLWDKVKSEHKGDYVKAKDGSPVPFLVDLKYKKQSLYLNVVLGIVFSLIGIGAFVEPALGLPAAVSILFGGIGAYSLGRGLRSIQFYSQNPYTVLADAFDYALDEKRHVGSATRQGGDRDLSSGRAEQRINQEIDESLFRVLVRGLQSRKEEMQLRAAEFIKANAKNVAVRDLPVLVPILREGLSEARPRIREIFEDAIFDLAQAGLLSVPVFQRVAPASRAAFSGSLDGRSEVRNPKKTVKFGEIEMSFNPESHETFQLMEIRTGARDYSGIRVTPVLFKDLPEIERMNQAFNSQLPKGEYVVVYTGKGKDIDVLGFGRVAHIHPYDIDSLDLALQLAKLPNFTAIGNILKQAFGTKDFNWEHLERDNREFWIFEQFPMTDHDTWGDGVFVGLTAHYNDNVAGVFPSNYSKGTRLYNLGHKVLSKEKVRLVAGFVEKDSPVIPKDVFVTIRMQGALDLPDPTRKSSSEWGEFPIPLTPENKESLAALANIAGLKGINFNAENFPVDAQPRAVVVTTDGDYSHAFPVGISFYYEPHGKQYLINGAAGKGVDIHEYAERLSRAKGRPISFTNSNAVDLETLQVALTPGHPEGSLSMEVLVPNGERSEVRMKLVPADYMAANDLLSYLAERSARTPPNPDVLLVLGNPDHQVNGEAAAQAYHALKPKWVLVAGKGKGVRAEALEFQDVLLANGVPKEKILIEDQSMNTGQNAQYGSKVLREDKKVLESGLLNQSISVVVTQKPVSERLSTDIMEKQFKWPKPISFYALAPRVPQVSEQTGEEEFFNLTGEALDQMGRFTSFAAQGFIEAEAARHPQFITQAVDRLKALAAARAAQFRSEMRRKIGDRERNASFDADVAGQLRILHDTIDQKRQALIHLQKHARNLEIDIAALEDRQDGRTQRNQVKLRKFQTSKDNVEKQMRETESNLKGLLQEHARLTALAASLVQPERDDFFDSPVAAPVMHPVRSDLAGAVLIEQMVGEQGLIYGLGRMAMSPEGNPALAAQLLEKLKAAGHRNRMPSDAILSGAISLLLNNASRAEGRSLNKSEYSAFQTLSREPKKKVRTYTLEDVQVRFQLKLAEAKAVFTALGISPSIRSEFRASGEPQVLSIETGNLELMGHFDNIPENAINITGQVVLDEIIQTVNQWSRKNTLKFRARPWWEFWTTMPHLVSVTEPVRKSGGFSMGELYGDDAINYSVNPDVDINALIGAMTLRLPRVLRQSPEWKQLREESIAQLNRTRSEVRNGLQSSIDALTKLEMRVSDERLFLAGTALRQGNANKALRELERVKPIENNLLRREYDKVLLAVREVAKPEKRPIAFVIRALILAIPVTFLAAFLQGRYGPNFESASVGKWIWAGLLLTPTALLVFWEMWKPTVFLRGNLSQQAPTETRVQGEALGTRVLLNVALGIVVVVAFGAALIELLKISLFQRERDESTPIRVVKLIKELELVRSSAAGNADGAWLVNLANRYITNLQRGLENHAEEFPDYAQAELLVRGHKPLSPASKPSYPFPTASGTSQRSEARSTHPVIDAHILQALRSGDSGDVAWAVDYLVKNLDVKVKGVLARGSILWEHSDFQNSAQIRFMEEFNQLATDLTQILTVLAGLLKDVPENVPPIPVVAPAGATTVATVPTPPENKTWPAFQKTEAAIGVLLGHFLQMTDNAINGQKKDPLWLSQTGTKMASSWATSLHSALLVLLPMEKASQSNALAGEIKKTFGLIKTEFKAIDQKLQQAKAVFVSHEELFGDIDAVSRSIQTKILEPLKEFAAKAQASREQCVFAKTLKTWDHKPYWAIYAFNSRNLISLSAPSKVRSAEDIKQELDEWVNYGILAGVTFQVEGNKLSIKNSADADAIPVVVEFPGVNEPFDLKNVEEAGKKLAAALESFSQPRSQALAFRLSPVDAGAWAIREADSRFFDTQPPAETPLNSDSVVLKNVNGEEFRLGPDLTEIIPSPQAQALGAKRFSGKAIPVLMLALSKTDAEKPLVVVYDDEGYKLPFEFDKQTGAPLLGASRGEGFVRFVSHLVYSKEKEKYDEISSVMVPFHKPAAGHAPAAVSALQGPEEYNISAEVSLLDFLTEKEKSGGCITRIILRGSVLDENLAPVDLKPTIIGFEPIGNLVWMTGNEKYQYYMLQNGAKVQVTRAEVRQQSFRVVKDALEGIQTTIPFHDWWYRFPGKNRKVIQASVAGLIATGIPLAENFAELVSLWGYVKPFDLENKRFSTAGTARATELARVQIPKIKTYKELLAFEATFKAYWTIGPEFQEAFGKRFVELSRKELAGINHFNGLMNFESLVPSAALSTESRDQVAAAYADRLLQLTDTRLKTVRTFAELDRLWDAAALPRNGHSGQLDLYRTDLDNRIFEAFGVRAVALAPKLAKGSKSLDELLALIPNAKSRAVPIWLYREQYRIAFGRIFANRAGALLGELLQSGDADHKALRFIKELEEMPKWVMSLSNTELDGLVGKQYAKFSKAVADQALRKLQARAELRGVTTPVEMQAFFDSIAGQAVKKFDAAKIIEPASGDPWLKAVSLDGSSPNDAKFLGFTLTPQAILFSNTSPKGAMIFSAGLTESKLTYRDQQGNLTDLKTFTGKFPVTAYLVKRHNGDEVLDSSGLIRVAVSADVFTEGDYVDIPGFAKFIKSKVFETIQDSTKENPAYYVLAKIASPKPTMHIDLPSTHKPDENPFANPDEIKVAIPKAVPPPVAADKNEVRIPTIPKPAQVAPAAMVGTVASSAAPLKLATPGTSAPSTSASPMQVVAPPQSPVSLRIAGQTPQVKLSAEQIAAEAERLLAQNLAEAPVRAKPSLWKRLTGRSELRESLGVVSEEQRTMDRPTRFHTARLDANSVAAMVFTAGRVVNRIVPFELTEPTAYAAVEPELFPEGSHENVRLSEAQVEEHKKAAMGALGIRDVADKSVSEVLVLMHGIFSQDPLRVAAGMRATYPGAVIVAIVNTPEERAFLKELNLHLAREDQQPVLAAGSESPDQLKKHIGAVHGSIRVTPLLYGSETIPEALKEQLPDENKVVVTKTMLGGFLNAVDALVSDLVTDLQTQYVTGKSA